MQNAAPLAAALAHQLVRGSAESACALIQPAGHRGLLAASSNTACAPRDSLGSSNFFLSAATRGHGQTLDYFDSCPFLRASASCVFFSVAADHHHAKSISTRRVYSGDCEALPAEPRHLEYPRSGPLAKIRAVPRHQLPLPHFPGPQLLRNPRKRTGACFITHCIAYLLVLTVLYGLVPACLLYVPTHLVSNGACRMCTCFQTLALGSSACVTILNTVPLEEGFLCVSPRCPPTCLFCTPVCLTGAA